MDRNCRAPPRNARRIVRHEAGARITVFFLPEYPIAYFGEGALIDPTTPEHLPNWPSSKRPNILARCRSNAEAGVECTTATATSDVLTKRLSKRPKSQAAT